MSKQRKALLWFSLILSIPAAGYTGISVIFYSWLNASDPERWPAAKAGLWAGGSFVLMLMFIWLFVYCVKSLMKNRKQS